MRIDRLQSRESFLVSCWQGVQWGIAKGERGDRRGGGIFFIMHCSPKLHGIIDEL